MNFVLMGMKHCGKSSIGRELSRRLECAFYDTDDMLLEGSGCFESIRRMYQALGAEEFRECEKKCIEKLSEKLAGTQLNVIALGGGLPCNEALAGRLKQLGYLIFIRPDEQKTFQRIAGGGIPSFLDPDDPQGSFAKLWKEREKHYLALADMIVETGTLGVDQSCDLIFEKLSAQGCLSSQKG